MFNPAKVLASAFGDHLATAFCRAFPDEKPHYADLLTQLTRETLQQLGTSDAPYHNADHTVMVTLVGQQIIAGKHKTKPLLPEDWLHYIVALLLHDIGFTRGLCHGDTPSQVVINADQDLITPPRGATDAYLAPYHVDRSQIYARQRFANSTVIDPNRIAKAIEYTRFPVPDDSAYGDTDSEPALVRAADLIGQIADPFYLCKISGLYSEFLETGFALQLGCTSPMDLVEQFPSFFHNQIEPVIGPALEHLKHTKDGRDVIEQLYTRVAQVSRGDATLGPFPGPEAG